MHRRVKALNISYENRQSISRETDYHANCIRALQPQINFWARFDNLIRDENILQALDGKDWPTFLREVANNPMNTPMEYEEWFFMGHQKDVIQRYLMEN